GPAFNHGNWFFFQTEGERAGGIELRGQDGARAVDLARRNVFENIARRRAQPLDCEIGGVVEGDYRAPRLDKFSQPLDSRFAQPSGVLRRVGAGNSLFASRRLASSARPACGARRARPAGKAV